MGESANNRNEALDVVSYDLAAGAIVIIGLIAIAYIGQQMSHGSSKVNVVVEASLSTLP
jgi:hypothetical protein